MKLNVLDQDNRKDSIKSSQDWLGPVHDWFKGVMILGHMKDFFP